MLKFEPVSEGKISLGDTEYPPSIPGAVLEKGDDGQWCFSIEFLSDRPDIDISSAELRQIVAKLDELEATAPHTPPPPP